MPGYLVQPQVGILSKSGALTSAVASAAGQASALLTQATSGAAATGSKLALIGTAGATVLGYALALAGVAVVGYACHRLVNPPPVSRSRASDAERTDRF